MNVKTKCKNSCGYNKQESAKLSSLKDSFSLISKDFKQISLHCWWLPSMSLGHKRLCFGAYSRNRKNKTSQKQNQGTNWNVAFDKCYTPTYFTDYFYKLCVFYINHWVLFCYDHCLMCPSVRSSRCHRRHFEKVTQIHFNIQNSSLTLWFKHYLDQDLDQD